MTSEFSKTCLSDFGYEKFPDSLKHGKWTDKTEATTNEFVSIPNLDSQAKNIMDDMEQLDSNVYNYQAGELINSMYKVVAIGNGADFTNNERCDIH